MPFQERVRFWREFIAGPRHVGSITPSSRSLAREMVDGVDWNEVRVVLEWGPGTGALTGTVLRRLRPGARLLAIERNPNLARVFRQRFPGVELHEASAGDSRDLCRAAGIETVDCILSSLPWAAFPENLQRKILRAGRAVLAPGGRFVTFAYVQGLLLPAGRRFRSLLDATFPVVETGRTVWRNVPPAFVYRCRA